jgi:hypothetical protein
LWEDITQLAEDRVEHPDASHFIGSLVLAPSPSNGPTGVQEYLVVDGQQRLTTLIILLCAIRDHRVSRARAEPRIARGGSASRLHIANFRSSLRSVVVDGKSEHDRG